MRPGVQVCTPAPGVFIHELLGNPDLDGDRGREDRGELSIARCERAAKKKHQYSQRERMQQGRNNMEGMSSGDQSESEEQNTGR